MKITAGFGSIDDYPLFAKAGADELFCGYIPESWMLQYGLQTPLNRREVLYYNVQIGSESELEILAKMIKRYNVPVSITVNGLFYAPEQYSAIARIVQKCAAMGFCSFIAADPALLLYLKKQEIRSLTIHVSGEMAEVNHYMVEEVRRLGAKRIIFHRKNTPEEMKQCILWEKEHHPEEPLEYEAFVLNELCHYTGAFCSCYHCDELVPSCRIPYRLGCYERTDEKEQNIQEQPKAPEMLYPDGYLTGRGGCGLCALWKLRDAGITHLKLVSRGNYAEDTARDIRQLRRALTILEKAGSEEEYIRNMKEALFEDGCSRECYY